MAAADQHNLCEVFNEFGRALDDIEEHLRLVHETAWGQGARWEGTRLGLCREHRKFLEEEIDSLFDARKRLHALAPKVAAHVIAPPGQTAKQWVVEVLALGDEAHRLAKEKYGHCNIYRGPMDPDLVVENYDDREWRKLWTDELRQIEEDYHRVRCGLPKVCQHLDRVMSVLLPPAADTEEVTVSEEKESRLPAPSTVPRRTGDVPSGSDSIAADERLSEAETRIINVIRAAGARQTTTKILAALGQRHGAASEGTTKVCLANLVRRKLLTNRQDVIPKGYGLPEWE